MADPNALVFMCAALRLRKRSRSPLHMKKRSCAATRAFPRLQAGAGALGAVSAPAQALAYPHCERIGACARASLNGQITIYSRIFDCKYNPCAVYHGKRKRL